MKTSTFYPFEREPMPDSCWSLSAGPDGRIYAASCCEGTPGGGAYIVRYNDETDSLDTVVDVAEATGEPLTSGRATQCKIHYSFAASASDGMLYAATHLSAPGWGHRRYSPWADWKDELRAFPHSTVLAYDTRRDEVAWGGPFIPREGCRCLALDEARGRLYAVSYPRDHFWIYDLRTRSIRDLGRIGSVNSQAVFTDRRGRVFTTNCSGQLLRYDPDTDRLEEIGAFVPHDPRKSRWHDVLYDVVASPEGDCVYGVPWNSDPHLLRYWPEDGEYGRMEDLGPVHQRRDPTAAVCFYLDHCGGLVFGADGALYFATTRWPEGDDSFSPLRREAATEGVLVRMDVGTLAKTDYARLEKPGAMGHYVSRGARDRFGNLFFGHVARPLPTGISRLVMGADGEDLHR
ncbi:MAG: hypothetical protein WBF17_07225, partial [Phycisphaerae bacterium]